MKTKIAVFIIIGLALSVVFANAPAYVIATHNDIPVYKSESHAPNAVPLFNLSTADRPVVVAADGNKFEIRNGKLLGWVEKSQVTDASGKTFVFGPADVTGYLDNPQPVFILDANGIVGAPLKLDRSFANEMKENVDRATINREVSR